MKTESTQPVNQELEKLCLAARRLLGASLLDFSGGNLSVRLGHSFYVTPKYAGEELGWELSRRHLVEVPLIEGLTDIPDGASRESWMHYELYRLEPAFAAVIHTHQRDLLCFACASRALRVPTQIEGVPSATVPVTEAARAGTRRLAKEVGRTVKSYFAGQGRAAVLIPQHGAVVAAESLTGAVGLLAAIANAAHVGITRMRGLAPG